MKRLISGLCILPPLALFGRFGSSFHFLLLITFVVGLRPDGRVADVAVMAYREPYGGEIRSARFLSQYHDKRPGDAVRPYRDIRNVAVATLSVEASSRAVKKELALASALGLTS